MNLKITECYKSAIGFLVVVETDNEERLRPGMRMKRNGEEFWEITAMAFSTDSTSSRPGEKNLRGYKIKPAQTISYIDCEAILNSKWEIL